MNPNHFEVLGVSQDGSVTDEDVKGAHLSLVEYLKRAASNADLGEWAAFAPGRAEAANEAIRECAALALGRVETAYEAIRERDNREALRRIMPPNPAIPLRVLYQQVVDAAVRRFNKGKYEEVIRVLKPLFNELDGDLFRRAGLLLTVAYARTGAWQEVQHPLVVLERYFPSDVEVRKLVEARESEAKRSQGPRRLPFADWKPE